MKKTSKTIISYLLSLVLVLSIFSGTSLFAFAEYSGQSGDLSWSFDNETGVLTVSGEGYGADYTGSGAPWYSYKADIKRVVVEDGVLGIGKYWFNYCSNITSVDLGTTLKRVGPYAFSRCTSLTSIAFPASMTEYYEHAFNGCSKLKWAVILGDNTVETYLHMLPKYMFTSCSSLEEILVSNNFTTVGDRTFNNCTKLHSIIWAGDSFSLYTTLSFNGVTLTNITFYGSNGVKSWANENGYPTGELSGSCGKKLNYSFDYNARTLNITGSGDMTSNPWSNYHYLINSVSFPANTMSICDNAFYGCENLTQPMTLGSNISNIGASAFFGAGCDEYTLESYWLTLGNNVFGGKTDIVFYGRANNGLYDYVKANKGDNNWVYYCLANSHSLSQTVVEPSCLSIGYSQTKCQYCDYGTGVENITQPLGHNYIYQCRSGKNIYYNCSRGDDLYHKENSQTLLDGFEDAIILKNGNLRSMSTFDSRYDIYTDGYINAKDYKVMGDMNSGIITDFDFNLNNKNATPETQKVYKYIATTYRNNIITGQQESTWMGSDDYEIDYIYNTTGEKPAIRGLDFMNDDYNGVVNRAKQWWNQGGIVTICWHCSKNFDKGYNESKVVNDSTKEIITANCLTAEQWDAVLTEGTPENQAFIAAMDKAGSALQELQKAGVPVLWRPFHEFDGQWFWWGKGGSERFKKLWIMMYNHYTYDLGLNNLIWVLGYCHNGGENLASWYPGNEYCDIIGADTYDEEGVEAVKLFNPVKTVCAGTKPMALHECGKIPTLQQLQTSPWGFFMTWHTTYITNDNTASSLKTIYNSDYAITLDELPNFK